MVEPADTTADERRWMLQQQYDAPEPETDEQWRKRLAALLPNDMGADWVGTNHYEINSEDVRLNGIRWGGCRSILIDAGDDPSGTEYGQFVGLIMEAACAFKPTYATLSAERLRVKELGEAADDYETALAKASWRGLTQDEHSMVEDAIRRARSILNQAPGKGEDKSND